MYSKTDPEVGPGPVAVQLRTARADDEEHEVRRGDHDGDRDPDRRHLDRTRPCWPVLPQEQEARHREHVREHIPDVAHVEDREVARHEQDERDVDEEVNRHRARRHVEPIEDAELLDRHPGTRDSVERAPAVGGRGVHREHEAQEQEDEHDAAEPASDELVERTGEELPLRALLVDEVGADRARDAQRQDHVDEEREARGRAERERRIALRVVVLGRKARADLDPVRRPAHQEQPDERDPQAAPLAADVPRHVRAVVIPGQEGDEHEHDERHHQQRARDVAEPEGGLHAEDVEDPDRHDQADCDHVREPEVVAADREVDVARRAREPLGHDEIADQLAEDREDDRPADPVPERRDRADQREVPAPALVRVERDAARLLREHRRSFGVDPVREQPDRRRDAPQAHRSPASEGADGVTEGANQEAGIAKSDDESVVPAKRLEQLSLLDRGLSHHSPPSSVVAAVTYHSLRTDSIAARTSALRSGQLDS